MDHSFDVGVTCIESGKLHLFANEFHSMSSLSLQTYLVIDGCSNGEIRLSNGSVPWEGRVEVCREGEWGTVCFTSTSFFRDAARVACRQLGYLADIGW